MCENKFLKEDYEMSNKKIIKVLVVEDSPVKKELLVSILNSDQDIEVIGTAADGNTAIAFLRKEQPDVITMDIHMPGMNGFETANKIMETNPIPIVIISSLRNNENRKDLSKAMLSAGALYFLDSPHGPWHPDFAKGSQEIVKYVKLMSKIKTYKRVILKNTPKQIAPKIAFKSKPSLIAIGVSTGGPLVLDKILSALPNRFTIPIVIALHIGHGFDLMLTKNIERKCKLPVHLAKDGDVINSGHVYFAQGGKNIQLDRASKISILEVKSNYSGYAPSINLFFKSVTKWHGKSAVAIILTGMGDDGVKEMKLLKEAGAVTIAQSRESCTVYGMPGEAVKVNAATHIMSIDEVIDFLVEL